MKFYQQENHVEFTGIDLFVGQLIRQIPDAANPEGSNAAERRLYPSPSMDNEELAEDWCELVVPELKTQFSSAISQVAHDVEEGLTGTDDTEFGYRLQIPIDHVDQWLSALNQARLVLGSRFAFTEAEMNEQFGSQLTTLREVVLYQIMIYGWMQELLLTALPGA